MPSSPRVDAPAFGAYLSGLRNGSKLEEIAASVRALVRPCGLKFDPSHLHKIEAGRVPSWPLLLALARVYGKTPLSMVSSLLEALEFPGSVDLIRHSGTGQSASDSASRSDDDHGTRAQLQQALEESAREIDRLHEQLQAAQQLAVRIVLIAEQGEEAGEGRPKSRRRRRKTG